VGRAQSRALCLTAATTLSDKPAAAKTIQNQSERPKVGSLTSAGQFSNVIDIVLNFHRL
jgi:hypothetical protein